MSNRLADETSPYLLQHKDNPVDWYPWGEEALGRAREEDRPILLSIGYSACHWCHVMERESFEDPAIAERHQHALRVHQGRSRGAPRPRLDLHGGVSGHDRPGGWPLNVFLTPEHVPFYAGTYFPPQPRMGMPSWRQVIGAVAEAWVDRREEIRAGADRIAAHLRGGALLSPSAEELDPGVLDETVAALAERYDRAHGGFGGAPKFPRRRLSSTCCAVPGRARRSR